MKALQLYIGKLVVLCFIVSAMQIITTASAADPVYPDWFWHQPERDGLQAVGYSIPYYNLQTSYDEAFENAAWRLFVDRSCHVSGGRALLETPGGFLAAGSHFVFDVDSAAFDQFRKQVVRVDSAVTRNLVIMMVSTVDIELETGKRPANGYPHISQYQSEEFNVAQGMGQRYLYESSSWEEAELNARIEAALTKNVELKLLEKKAGWQNIRTFIAETDVILQGIQTVARGVDPVTGSKMVIVQVR